jgi:hypothetical protein
MATVGNTDSKFRFVEIVSDRCRMSIPNPHCTGALANEYAFSLHPFAAIKISLRNHEPTAVNYEMARLVSHEIIGLATLIGLSILLYLIQARIALAKSL